MVAVKREYTELFSCDSEFELISEDYPAAFKRSTKGKTLYCAFNPTEREYKTSIPCGKVISSMNAKIEGDEVTLAPLSYVWIVTEK